MAAAHHTGRDGELQLIHRILLETRGRECRPPEQHQAAHPVGSQQAKALMP